ncbi:MAG: hypothetical protein ACRDS0_41525 [Pseudonocardiaceae bacterium]
MIDKDQEELPEPSEAENVGSGGMAEALESIKAASPSLAADIDAAKVTPDSLAGSHDRATSDDSATSAISDQQGRHAAAD